MTLTHQEHGAAERMDSLTGVNRQQGSPSDESPARQAEPTMTAAGQVGPAHTAMMRKYFTARTRVQESGQRDSQEAGIDPSNVENDTKLDTATVPRLPLIASHLRNLCGFPQNRLETQPATRSAFWKALEIVSHVTSPTTNRLTTHACWTQPKPVASKSSCGVVRWISRIALRKHAAIRFGWNRKPAFNQPDPWFRASETMSDAVHVGRPKPT